ncbi:MAG: hypothetical protein ACOX8E_11795 [Ruminococcus sp.]|jgi:ABC-type lipoprotein release transport system permease subunit
MTYGEILMVCGAGLAALGVLVLITGAIVMNGRKKRLKQKLYDRYGL